MLRKTKIIGGGTLVASAAVGIAVPAYAASTSPTAPSTTAPSTKSPAQHLPRTGRGLEMLGLTPAVIAKAAGTDVAGLKAGRAAKKSLAQIAASHNVSRATLLSRLDTAAAARITKLINTKLNAKAPAGWHKKPNAMPPKAGATPPDGPKREGRHRHGPRGIPGIGGDVKSLASTLKVTPNVLRADLKKGQTLQQIATANKVSTATLIAAIDKDVNTQLARTVDRVPQAKKATAAPGSSTS